MFQVEFRARFLVHEVDDGESGIHDPPGRGLPAFGRFSSKADGFEFLAEPIFQSVKMGFGGGGRDYDVVSQAGELAQIDQVHVFRQAVFQQMANGFCLGQTRAVSP